MLEKMQTSWTTDFLRQTLMNGVAERGIHHWCAALVELLQEHKADHDLHLFGISRTPRDPNYLLASSQETLPGEPLRINFTEQTANVFLAPAQPGVRFLREEFPMTITYDVPNTEPPKRQEVAFYEAICFDTADYSIIMGLIVHEGELEEFLPSDEMAELLPLIRSQGIPLLELYISRQVGEQQREEIRLMMSIMRESNPEIQKMNLASLGELISRPASIAAPTTNSHIFEAAFLQYIVQELRAPLAQIMAANDRVLELTANSFGNAELAELTNKARLASELQLSVLRNLSNVAALCQDARPRTGVFAMQQLIRELYPLAVERAAPYHVQIKLEELTRNIYVSGDRETLFRMAERIFEHVFPFCAEGTLYIRTEDNSDRVDHGFVVLEFEDTGEVPDDVPASALLNRQNVMAVNHPRLRRGGGVLFQLLGIYMEKVGGKFRLSTGLNGNFSIQMILPLVSHSEMERIKAGEI